MNITNYCFPILITNNRTVYCKELKNVHYKNIVKYIENKDDHGLGIYFESLVNELCIDKTNLNYIDKYLILISIRMVCINSLLIIETPSKIKSSIRLEDIIKKIIQNFSPNTRTITCDKNIKVEIGYPNIISNKDNIFDKIHTININNDKVNFKNITEQEKDQILSLLPASIAQDIYDEVKKEEIYQEIKLFSYFVEEGEEQEYFFSYDSNTNFALLKSLYNDSLKNLYYYEYICAYKLHISINDFLYNMSPVESVLQIKTLSNELQAQQKASKAANKKSDPQPGLGSPR